MSITRYKICPGCGKKNPAGVLECRYCETDLTSVSVTDDEQESQRTSQIQTVRDSEKAALVRICDCGAQNPPQARKCKVCGEDISDILPTPIAVTEKQPFTYELRSVDGAFSMEVDKALIVIGRECEMKEYLQTKRYVSRQQAKLSIVAEKVFIENLSRTNKTFVNNNAVAEGTATELHNQDEIGLGGKCINGVRQSDAAYFVFSIKA